MVRPGAGRAGAETHEPAAASSVVAEVSVQADQASQLDQPSSVVEVASTQASQLDQPLSSKTLGHLVPTIRDHALLLFVGRTLVNVI